MRVSIGVFAGLLVFAQAPDHFEVAVIRPDLAGAAAGTSVDLFAGGRVKIVNEPVKLLLRMAFKLQNAQIAGGPAWVDTDRYDIEAKTGRPEKIKLDQMGPLMQDLLAERFHLKFHHETRELTVYGLVVAKGGAKLRPMGEGETSASSTTGGHGTWHLTATATSTELLAGYIGNRLEQIVVDQTGLAGAYDFKLDWAADQAQDSTSPSLITALREQLGLRLESRKSPVDVLVIDRIDRPTEN